MTSKRPSADALLTEAFRGLAPNNEQMAQAAKKAYSEQMSHALAHALAQELRYRGMDSARPLPPGEGDASGAERRMAGGIGAKKVDVTWATEEAGLLVALTIKTINWRDGKTRTYQKNLTNRRNDMLFEAVTLHRRFPYAVLVGLLVFPDAAERDGTDGRESTFQNAHTLIRMFTDRTDPAGRDEQFERFYIGLHSASATTLNPGIRFFVTGRAEHPVPTDEVFDHLVGMVVERNPDLYRVENGSVVPVQRRRATATSADEDTVDEGDP